MPVRKLKEFLDEHQVKYVALDHSPAYTAQEIAASAHVRGREMAKTVIVTLEGKMAIRVVTNPDLKADAANANRQHFELCEGEAFLIPEGFVHQYINLTDQESKFFFAIGSDF